MVGGAMVRLAWAAGHTAHLSQNIAVALVAYVRTRSCGRSTAAGGRGSVRGEYMHRQYDESASRADCGTRSS